MVFLITGKIFFLSPNHLIGLNPTGTRLEADSEVATGAFSPHAVSQRKPPCYVQLQRQLDQFRSTQPRRTKLPESLRQAAVELARQYGIYSGEHPLRLDYIWG